MKLTRPKQITWIVALVLCVVGILGTVVRGVVAIPSNIAIWSLIISSVLLLLATVIKGL